MLDIYRVRTRIEEINRRLRILNRDFKPLEEEKLTTDETINAAAERHLQIAIQASLDIANHLVASLGLKRPAESAGEVFETLASEGIIPQTLGEKLIKATGYRNILTHEYADVDRHQTYLNLQNNLPDLSEFAKYIELFLEKQESK